MNTPLSTLLQRRRALFAAAKKPSTFFLFVLVFATAGQNMTYATDLAHWAANGGWVSTWSMVSTWNSPLACTLSFRDPSGKPLSLNTTAGNGSSIGFNLAVGGSARIAAGGSTGSVQTGSSTVSCPGTFTTDVTYTWEPDGVPLTQVTVLPTTPSSNFVFAANTNTGIALYDPSPVTDSATITAFDAGGNQVDSGTTTIPTLGKNTFNLNQLLTKLPDSFEGSVTVAANGPLEAAVLDVTLGTNGSFVLGNVPVIGFNTQGSSSASYKFISGPLSGQTGTFSVVNAQPFGNGPGSGYYFGTVTSGSSSGGVIFIEMGNKNTFFRFNGSPGFPLSGAIGAVTFLSDGSFTGSFVLQGSNGINVGTITGK